MLGILFGVISINLRVIYVELAKLLFFVNLGLNARVKIIIRTLVLTRRKARSMQGIWKGRVVIVVFLARCGNEAFIDNWNTSRICSVKGILKGAAGQGERRVQVLYCAQRNEWN